MTAGTGGIGGLPPVGASVCTPTADDCSISHASTGWCLAATGQPVIVVTRIPCEGDADPTIQMVLASTGAVVPNQQVVPCAGNDWETETLCDFALDGSIIAVVTQIFQWNEATGGLTIKLVRADDPSGPPYVVQGQLRQCSDPSWVDVETALVCGNTAGTLRQLTELIVWDTRNGSIIASLYLDAEGNTAVPNVGETFAVGDCYTPVLPSILDEAEITNVELGEVNTKLDAQTALLTTIRDNADQVEPLLIALGANTDQIEPLLIQIRDNADTLETLSTAANVLLTQIRDNADQVEPLLIAIGNNTDGLEGLSTAANGLLTTLASAIKNEDAVPADGDPGIPALARRNDTGVATTTADGDYTHLATDSAGRIGVTNLNGSPLAVAGTVAVNNFPTTFEIANDVGNPIPVSGTVTVTDGSGPLTVDGTVNVTGVSTSANQTNGTQKSIVRGGAKGTTAAADVTSTASGANHQGLDVVLYDTTGNVIAPLTDAQLRLTPVGVTDAALVTTNAQLTAIAGYTDGIEGLLTAANGFLTNIAATTFLEDSVHTSGDRGTFALAVRNDADAVRTSADGDYSPISVDSAGRVKITGSVNITDGIGPITVDGTVSLADAKLEDSPAASGDSGIQMLAVRNDADAVRTSADGDYSSIAVDSAGRVKVVGSVAITNSSIEIANDVGNPVPVSGTVAVSNFPTSVEVSNDVGNPLPVSGTVTISNASIEISNDLGNPVPVSGTVTITDGSGPVTVDGTVNAAEAKNEDAPAVSGDSGIQMLAVRNDTDAVRTSADGDYSALAVDSAGRVKTVNAADTALLTSILAALGDTGISMYRNISANNTGAVIKGSSGKVLTVLATNLAAGSRFLKLYNKATAPVAADTPVMTIPLQGPANGNNVTLAFSNGVLFNLGIGVRVTTGIGDADTGNPAANEVILNIGYQ